MMNYTPPLELVSNLQNEENINASVIWLHGLGADGYDFAPIVKQLFTTGAFSAVRFILPHAPDMAVTRNNGYIMPAWYDIYGVIPVEQEDEAGIHSSQRYINSLIQQEVHRGIPCERIVLAGFSQGGAIALHTALHYPQPLAGVLALSTYLPLHAKLAADASACNQSIPIFMAQGIYDEVITPEMSKLSRDLLLKHHYTVHWHEYPMGHSLCAEEIMDIEKFLRQVLS